MFLSKKVIILLFICFIATLLFIKPVHAVSVNLKQLTGQDWDAGDQMQFTLDKMMSGWRCKFVLTSGCEVEDQQGNVFAYTGTPTGGAIGQASTLMAGLYNSPPTSSVYYVASIGQSIGLVPKSAYAAVGGSGNQIITPIYQLWDEAKKSCS